MFTIFITVSLLSGGGNVNVDTNMVGSYNNSNTCKTIAAQMVEDRNIRIPGLMGTGGDWYARRIVTAKCIQTQ